MKSAVENVAIPPAMFDLAQRRTEFLFRVMTYGDRPMREVLASAYMQGMNDMFDTCEHAGLLQDRQLTSAMRQET